MITAFIDAGTVNIGIMKCEVNEDGETISTKINRLKPGDDKELDEFIKFVRMGVDMKTLDCVLDKLTLRMNVDKIQIEVD